MQNLDKGDDRQAHGKDLSIRKHSCDSPRAPSLSLTCSESGSHIYVTFICFYGRSPPSIISIVFCFVLSVCVKVGFTFKE